MISKYRARLAFTPFYAKLRRMLGNSWTSIGEKLGREVMLAQASEILANSDFDKVKKSNISLDVIFLTMIGGHGYNTSVDIVLGLALKARGHRVRYVVCDQQLPLCETKKSNNVSNWKAACDKCWAYGKSIYAKFGLDIIPVSALIKDRELKIDPESYQEIIEASLLKHLQVGILKESDLVAERREMIKKSVATSHAVGQALVAMNPDRVLMSHGIYSTWGPQLNLLNEAKIPVVTFSKCKKKNTEKLNWTTSADWWDVSNEWENVANQPLTPEQHKQIDSYLDSRRSHSQDTMKFNHGSEEARSDVFAKLGLDETKPTFVAFTNVLWDAASAHREIVFPDPTTWILDTIEWFSERPERQLVVKIHPAEAVVGTNQPFASIIRDRFPTLPANIHIIEPEQKTNSWSIIKIADLGLAHTSTVGMEMPLEGVPCAVLSRTHYRGRGFTIDVNNRDEYFHLIENWNRDDHNIEEMKTVAKRYAFLLFERYQLPFPFLNETGHTDVRSMNFSSVSNLANHPVMKLITDSIEEKRDFLLPPDPADIKEFWGPVS